MSNVKMIPAVPTTIRRFGFVATRVKSLGDGNYRWHVTNRDGEEWAQRATHVEMRQFVRTWAEHAAFEVAVQELREQSLVQNARRAAFFGGAK
jgi:hypothetical protein